jgi:hypothetical protein
MIYNKKKIPQCLLRGKIRFEQIFFFFAYEMYSPTTTKVGHERYQSPALSLLQALILFLKCKETPSFKVDKTGFNM